MSAEVRAQFESRLGETFSDVRIHTGPAATQAARALNTRAFTVGRHVVFDRNEYAPASLTGQAVLAEELVHVAQQRRLAGVRVDCWGGRTRAWWARRTDPVIAELDRRYPNIVREMVSREYQRSAIEAIARATQRANWQVNEQVLRYMIEHHWYSNRITDWLSVFRQMVENRYSASDIEAIARYAHQREWEVNPAILRILIENAWSVEHVRQWEQELEETTNIDAIQRQEERNVQLMAIDCFANAIVTQSVDERQKIFRAMTNGKVKQIIKTVRRNEDNREFLRNNIRRLSRMHGFVINAINETNPRPTTEQLQILEPILTNDWAVSIGNLLRIHWILSLQNRIAQQRIRNVWNLFKDVHPQLIFQTVITRLPTWWIREKSKQLRQMNYQESIQFMQDAVTNWNAITRAE